MNHTFLIPSEITEIWKRWGISTNVPPAQGFDYGEYSDPSGMKMGYRAFTALASGAHPLVIYMGGTHHNNNETNDWQIRNVACHTLSSPFFPVPSYVLAPWIDTPGHMPNTDEGRKTNLKYSAVLDRLIRSFIREHDVDASRIYFIGVGGGGQYQHVALGADLYAAIAMNTSVFDYFADGQENQYLKLVSHIPVFLSHGIADKPNPVRRSRLEYTLFREAGNEDVLYHEYSEDELIQAGADLDTFDGAHNAACALPFLSEELYQFVFSKVRK